MPAKRILPAPASGSKALRKALVEAGRRGKKRAAMATGRHILIAAYAILKAPDTVYRDLGINYFDQRDRQAVVRRETRRLEALGYTVTIEPSAPPVNAVPIDI